MAKRKLNTLIVDDEKEVLDLLYEDLTRRGYLCATVQNGNDTFSKLATQHFDIALIDIRLPDISGMEVLKRIQRDYPDTVAIMLTAVNDIDVAVEAMKCGALDYIVKPFDLNRLNVSIRAASKQRRRLAETLPSEMEAIASGVEVKLNQLVGHSRTVIDGTVEVARQLGIPQRKIKRWVSERAILDYERNRLIDSSLSKLKENLSTKHQNEVTDVAAA